MIYLPGRNDLSARIEWFWNDTGLILFALAFHFIKKLGNIHFFWQAVPMIYHLNGSYHSSDDDENDLPGLEKLLVVFGSPVTRLQKDRNQTGLGPRSGLFPVTVFRFRKWKTGKDRG
jgi:hypothetical protein